MYSVRCVDRGLKSYRVEMARCFQRRLSPKLFQFRQRGIRAAENRIENIRFVCLHRTVEPTIAKATWSFYSWQSISSFDRKVFSTVYRTSDHSIGTHNWKDPERTLRPTMNISTRICRTCGPARQNSLGTFDKPLFQSLLSTRYICESR